MQRVWGAYEEGAVVVCSTDGGVCDGGESCGLCKEDEEREGGAREKGEGGGFGWKCYSAGGQRD